MNIIMCISLIIIVPTAIGMFGTWLVFTIMFGKG